MTVTTLLEMRPGDPGSKEMAALLKEIRLEHVSHLKAFDDFGAVRLTVDMHPTDEEAARIRELIEQLNPTEDS